MNEDSGFYILTKLFNDILYDEISNLELIQNHNLFILKTMISLKFMKEHEAEHFQKILDICVPVFYFGIFFSPYLEFQLSSYLFEKILDKPMVFSFILTILNNFIF